jgi:hypothetical protein
MTQPEARESRKRIRGERPDSPRMASARPLAAPAVRTLLTHQTPGRVMPSCPRDVPPGPARSLRNGLANTGAAESHGLTAPATWPARSKRPGTAPQMDGLAGPGGGRVSVIAGWPATRSTAGSERFLPTGCWRAQRPDMDSCVLITTRPTPAAERRLGVRSAGPSPSLSVVSSIDVFDYLAEYQDVPELTVRVR